MKNFRFKITVSATSADGLDNDPILIKTMEHTLRDVDLSEFGRLLHSIPFDTTGMFNGADISHILNDSRDLIANAGAIQFKMNEPQVGHDFKYIDSLRIGERRFHIKVHFELVAIEVVTDAVAKTDKKGAEYGFLEVLKRRIDGMAIEVIGSYHLIGMLRREGTESDPQIRMVLYRPTKRLPYVQKHRRDDAGTPIFVSGEVVFQMTGDRDWEVLPRYADDQFTLAIVDGQIEVVANVVMPYKFFEDRDGKEEIEKWLKK